MPKNVVAILPGGQVEHIAVADELATMRISGEKGATLELPIESYKLGGETYLVARFSGLVSDQETESAIRQFY
ncbi:FIG00554821: hypothetical protein [Cronobacter condimenti 1330]|uniref:Uncharacterized protein n=1 Tax=Cronobacter condimenti 1330 TaxID=1073999 RepID=K8A2M5_9ENTR|nr:hypothetical protein [Cronobacter condimenti]ALB62586.1 hypothetical protein AFK62_08775 [Cronobacter condimenti 1330]CCJ73550.1 FIG00554821: hypothetical protein [Cronobacter condimenti 1330]